MSLRDIQLNLGGAQILDDVSLDIPSRHLSLVIGPSGAGKSTLARVAAGILEPDAGSVTLAGKPVVRGAIGLALQRPEDQLFLNSVQEDVEFGPMNLGASREEARRRSRRSLKLLKVPEDLWSRSPFQLSGGEKRRVAIAGVIAMSPAALVLDEPTDGLDASCRAILINAVRNLADQGLPVIVVSHDVGEWMYAADDIVLLEGGRIRWRGTPPELAAAYGVLERWGVGVPLELAMLGELAREGQDAH
ncbi:MAG: ATP-binding cassette domain-containing protein [Parolsenella sp.]|uniref:energy-coupling factor ABC transporter ATP-binding protein n=1 Tax=Parolsenella sp. TaxID=2083006 RepID=UPI002E75B44D|nr:ATP-binding cassette domain-containing protein [Parolsenella sp.]MEE1372494.1 ATP-binding cassette domain-containing protein [Parolsenella sp.]